MSMNPRSSSTARPLRSLVLLLAFAFALRSLQSAGPPSLADFGYRSLGVASGNRPLLVVVCECAGSPPNPVPKSFYQDLFFGPTQQNVHDYYLEASNGRFTWTPAGPGVVRLSIPANKQRDANPNFLTYAIQCALTNLDQAEFDTNPRDGTLTGEELQIFYIDNITSSSIAVSGPAHVPATSTTLALKNIVPTLSCDNAAGLYYCIHELFHTFGAVDLYGIWCESSVDVGLSLMSVSVVHPDPWHKMQVGWSTPRIRSLTDGGIVDLPLTNAPVILYAPSHGASEFFMLEYRAWWQGYENDLPTDGLVIWHIAQDTNTHKLLKYAQAAYPAADKNWYECTNCSSLVKGVFQPCPRGGSHRLFQDNHWILKDDPMAPGEHGWRECDKCGGIFYPDELRNACAAGGKHNATGSDFAVFANAPDICLHRNWRHCTKCGVLYGPPPACQWAPESCAAGGTHNGGGASYSVIASWVFDAALSEGSANNGLQCSLGGSDMWTSDMVTPLLRWFSGGESKTRLHVLPFNFGANVITVEWWSEVWVDFSYTGLGYGTFDRPFNTLALGLLAVSDGGVLHIKTGTSAETATMSKRMTLQAFNGLVTIGQQ